MGSTFWILTGVWVPVIRAPLGIDACINLSLLVAQRAGELGTVEARKLEYDCPPDPKAYRRKQTSKIVTGPYSNLLGFTAWDHDIGC